MKTIYNILLVMVAALALSACQKESAGGMDEEVAVCITAAIPDAAFRKAAGDGACIDKVYYEVWSKDFGKVVADGSQDVDGCTASVDLKLIRDKEYEIILWAQCSTCQAYSWETLKEINISYKEAGQEYAQGNAEERDAFYAVSKIRTYGMVDKYISLTRPFSQLNFFSEHLDFYQFEGYEIQIQGLSDVFDTIAGEGKSGNGQTCTFKADAQFTSGQSEKDGKMYDHLAMNYIMVPGQIGNIDMNVTFSASKDGNMISANHEMSNVTVKANERVNIYGELIIK